jgi:hypothetical protein
MKRSIRRIADYRMACVLLLIAVSHGCLCQRARPGLSGMSPSKFLVIRHTQAPGRSLQTSNGALERYNQEDLYFKVWVPLLYKPRFYFLAAPQYRTEQLEFREAPMAEITPVSHWNLRSMGLDVRACYRLDSTSWIAGNVNANRSGNLADVPDRRIPVTFTATAVFLKKKSEKKEVGYGVLMSKGYNRFNVLPVVVFNYNFSAKSGIEISLPHKIAWRRNVSPGNILHLKAEASSRNYTLLANNKLTDFRRMDLDLAVVYNKSINKFAGFEVSTGYRRNLQLEFPCDIAPVDKSGLTFLFELYLKPPVK